MIGSSSLSDGRKESIYERFEMVVPTGEEATPAHKPINEFFHQVREMVVVSDNSVACVPGRGSDFYRPSSLLPGCRHD